MTSIQIRGEHKYRTEWISQSEILLPDYQRKLKPGWVQHITSGFNPAYLGTLAVSRRKDGKFYIVDGQHRLEAIRSLGPEYAEKKVECRVYDGLTLQEEAELFRRLNDFKAVRLLDKWRARRFAGDPIVEEITKIARLAGYYRIDETALSCVGALEKVYGGVRVKTGEGPKILANTLKICSEAFGVDGQSPTRNIIEGIAIVLETSNGNVDIERLTKRLARRRGGADKIIGDAKTWQTNERGGLSAAVAQVVVSEYNVGLREGHRLASIR